MGSPSEVEHIFTASVPLPGPEPVTTTSLHTMGEPPPHGFETLAQGRTKSGRP